MKINYDVLKVDYRTRLRNLSVSAQSSVKSDKFFPVFLIDGNEKIFKPLSKTKPLSTPYFAYSEVVWSNILHDFFDKSIPIYKLAMIENIEDDFPSKYHHGVLVDNIEEDGSSLVNLYEYYRDNPDDNFSILEYENYCGEVYNYQKIFDTKFMIENIDIAKEFAYQLLMSILKSDENYHYENPLFKSVNGKLSGMAPMIDHEFSTMFLLLDNILAHDYHFGKATHSLLFMNHDFSKYSLLQQRFFSTIARNLRVIINKFPDVSYDFLEKLRVFLEYIKENPLVLEDKGYMVPFNSQNYNVGRALYKENNLEEAEKLRSALAKQQYNPDINQISERLNAEIQIFGTLLGNEIVKRLERK